MGIAFRYKNDTKRANNARSPDLTLHGCYQPAFAQRLDQHKAGLLAGQRATSQQHGAVELQRQADDRPPENAGGTPASYLSVDADC